MRDSSTEISTLTIFAIAFPSVDGWSTESHSIKNGSCLSSSVPRTPICSHTKSFPSGFVWWPSTAAQPKRFSILETSSTATTQVSQPPPYSAHCETALPNGVEPDDGWSSGHTTSRRCPFCNGSVKLRVQKRGWIPPSTNVLPRWAPRRWMVSPCWSGGVIYETSSAWIVQFNLIKWLSQHFPPKRAI